MGIFAIWLGVAASLPPSSSLEDETREVAWALTGAPLRESERLGLASLLVRTGRRYRLDPLLLAAVIDVESSFSWRAISPKGARGLMQLLPSTGLWLAKRKNLELGGPDELDPPEVNVDLGAFYLSALTRQFDTLPHALLAYNSGPARARRILGRADLHEKLCGEYPAKVLKRYRKLSRKTFPPGS